MAADLSGARRLVTLGPAQAALLSVPRGRSCSRSVVLAARVAMAVAPQPRARRDAALHAAAPPAARRRRRPARADQRRHVSDGQIAYRDDDVARAWLPDRRRLPAPRPPDPHAHRRRGRASSGRRAARSLGARAATSRRASRGCLGTAAPPLLACGAELKSAFCVARERARVGRHASRRPPGPDGAPIVHRGRRASERLFMPITLELVAHDLGFPTSPRPPTPWSGRSATLGVQHHHAHLAAPASPSMASRARPSARSTTAAGAVSMAPCGAGSCWSATRAASRARDICWRNGAAGRRLRGGRPWRMACAWLLAARRRGYADLPATLQQELGRTRRWADVARLACSGLAAPRRRPAPAGLLDGIAAYAACGAPRCLLRGPGRRSSSEALADRAEPPPTRWRSLTT